MRPALVLWAVMTACSFTPRDGQFRCLDGVCPAGQTCVAGVCRSSAPPDAPELDVTPTDALDAPELDAPLVETCTGADAAPADEDADGIVDETCPYALGTPHAVLSGMPEPGEYYSVELVEGGLTLVTAGSRGSGVFAARRPRLDAEFEVATPLVRAAAGTALEAMSMTEDAAELYVQLTDAAGRSRIGVSRLVTGSWSPPVEPAELQSAMDEEAVHPFVRRDGLELYIVRRRIATNATQILRYTRTARTLTWVAAPITAMDASLPTLSQDGHTLYYLDAFRQPRFSMRRDLADPFALDRGDPRLPPPLSGRLALRPFFHPSTHEVFYVHQNATLGMGVAEAPGPSTIFRAEVCRDGDCSMRTMPCPSGIRSADGLHCFRDGGTQAFVPRGCGGDEHHATLHSPSDSSLLRDRFGDRAWLGFMASAWVTGEPLSYDEFGGSLPAIDRCAVVTSSDWVSEACTELRPVVCETDSWPVFVP